MVPLLQAGQIFRDLPAHRVVGDACRVPSSVTFSAALASDAIQPTAAKAFLQFLTAPGAAVVIRSKASNPADGTLARTHQSAMSALADSQPHWLARLTTVRSARRDRVGEREPLARRERPSPAGGREATCSTPAEKACSVLAASPSPALPRKRGRGRWSRWVRVVPLLRRVAAGRRLDHDRALHVRMQAAEILV